VHPRSAIARSSRAARGDEYRWIHFHRLQGKPKRWSVRVNKNYRITFGWIKESAIDIDYEDYH